MTMAKKEAKPATKGNKKVLKGSSKLGNTKLMFGPGGTSA
jgi:hypothetical protein